jgi:hypothetical protein
MSIQSLNHDQRNRRAPRCADGDAVRCHYAETTAKREQSDGSTFLNSPYIPLGRDQKLKAERSGLHAGATKIAQALWRGMQQLLVAMHKSRRKQAIAMIARYADLIAPEAEALISEKPLEPIREAGIATPRKNDVEGPEYVMSIRRIMNCPITGAPCEGELSYLCDDWNCARKGGLSSVSHENF